MRPFYETRGRWQSQHRTTGGPGPQWVIYIVAKKEKNISILFVDLIEDYKIFNKINKENFQMKKAANCLARMNGDHI